MALYPGALPALDSDHDNEPSRLIGPDSDQIAAEVNAIATELGLNPRGGYSDVAARLSALGAGGGGSGSIFVDVTASPFSADKTGVADCTAAIQAAIDVLGGWTYAQPTGGTVFFPKGAYKITGSLDCKQTGSVTLLGEGNPIHKGVSDSASSLMFTQTGYNICIDARSAIGFTLKNLGIYHTSTGFTGDVINFAHAPSGLAPDSGDVLIDGCVITGPYVARSNEAPYAITPADGCSANSLINLQEAIFCKVKNCHLGYAKRGIVGKFIGPYTTTNYYSNGMDISGNQFIGMTIGAIVNPGESWNITGNGFEGPLMGAAVTDDLTGILDGNIARGGTFTGNWLGDIGTGQNPNGWFTSRNSMSGWIIAGNSFGGTAFLNIGSRGSMNSILTGIVIEGNDFFFNFGNPVNMPQIQLNNWSGHAGILIQGNTFNNATPGSPIAGITGTTGVQKLRIQANTGVNDLVQ